MEIPSREHLEDREDKAIAGHDGNEIYSMGHGGPHTKEAAERDLDAKLPSPEKQKNEILYWRLGLAFAIILIFVSVIYFIGKGVDWAIKKLNGQQSGTYSSSIYTNADPRLAQPTEPVISNQNVVPVSAAPNSTILSNNCPAYIGSSVFYCEWQNQYIFRPFQTQQEYAAAHGGNPAIIPSSPSMPVTVYSSLPPPGASLNQAVAASQQRSPLLANGCPNYTDGAYVRCEWQGPYIFRGFHAGE